jgi:predicted  nucleic acid-binding Zn-ribbon protein
MSETNQEATRSGDDFGDLPRYLEDTIAFDDANDVFDLQDSDDPFFSVEATEAESGDSGVVAATEAPPHQETARAPVVPAPIAQRTSRAAIISIGAGAALAGSGLVLMILTLRTPEFAGGLMAVLERLQILPAHLVIAGIVMLGLGGIRRHQLQTQHTNDAVLRSVERNAEIGEDGLEQLYWLVERNSGEKSTQEEIQCILHVLQRQDEKIANLTRAIKMYGKPLMEITNQLSDTNQQVTEISGALSEMKGSVPVDDEETGQSLARAVRRIGDDLKRDLERSLDSLGANRGTDELQPLLDEMRGAIGALRKDLEDLRESRPSIDLGPIAKETREAIEALRKELADTDAPAPAALDIETPIRDVQKQIRGLEALIHSLAHGPAAPQRAPAPAQESAPQPQSKPAAESSDDDRSPSISGRKKGDGNAVLGAIEKLKRLRG